MSDLREAAEMALEALMQKGEHHPKVYQAAEALRQALAEPEQDNFNKLIRIMGTFDLATGHADSWDDLLDSLETELSDIFGYYRAKREWVGLTDKEIHEVVSKKWWDWEDAFDIEGFSRSIEAKLKEKNNG